MSIARWDPFREMEALRENVNRLFQEALGGPARGVPSARPWAPAVDVVEDDEKIVVKAELPGMRKEDVEVELTGDTLTIRGERKFEEKEEKQNYIRVERAYGRFQRAFTIGVPIKADDLKANYKEGVLEITIPKAEEVKPKKVDVEVS